MSKSVQWWLDCDWYSMAFDISFPFICRENSRRSGIPLFPTILRTQRFRLSCSSRMVGDKSGKLGLILCNNFPEAPEISAMISDHSSNYYVGHKRHSLAGCQPSNKSISAYKSKSISLSTNDVTNFWSPLWLKHQTWPVWEFSIGKSRSATNFRLWRCLSLKETKSSLVSIINILKIINACEDSVKRGKNCTDEWFYFLCGVIMLWVKLC